MKKYTHIQTTILAIVFIMLFAGRAFPQLPTILVNGTTTLVTGEAKYPYWLSEGQTLEAGNKVNYISVLQYNIVSATGGKDLIFDSVISVTSQQTVPYQKAWKIESVSLDITAGTIGFTGVTGPTGADGATGSTGITGPTGSGTTIQSMTTAQINAIPSPDNGMIVFNTDCNTFSYNAGTPAAPDWESLIGTNTLVCSVNITANPAGSVNQGTYITFTANITNGGSSPTYQWKKNGSDVTGETNSTYAGSAFSNGDIITCVVTSGLACVTGSPATSNAYDIAFAGSNGYLTFVFTGMEQKWIVPVNVTSITIEVFGAQGGDGYRPGNQGTGGKGGYATGKKTVTPGDTLRIYVGGQGKGGQTGTGGYNGGGNGGMYSSSEAGGGGGGATDVRLGGSTLANRIIVGGAGGGGSNTTGANGGYGGYTSGSNGAGSYYGYGGSQTSGGNGGGTGGNGGPGNPGGLGYGGNAGSPPSCGGGGGAGYYGGGGGGGCNSGGGGGGSSYIGGMTSDTSTTDNARIGDGLVIISW